MLSLFGFGMCIYCMGERERVLLYVAFCAPNSQLLVRVIYTVYNMYCRKKNLHGSFYAAMFTVFGIKCALFPKARNVSANCNKRNNTIRYEKRKKKTIERQRHVNDCNVNVALKLCAIFLFTSTSKQRYTFCTICCYCYSFIF